jgi:hypothetical protein
MDQYLTDRIPMDDSAGGRRPARLLMRVDQRLSSGSP